MNNLFKAFKDTISEIFESTGQHTAPLSVISVDPTDDLEWNAVSVVYVVKSGEKYTVRKCRIKITDIVEV